MNRVLRWALLVPLALALAACGGSSDSSSSDAATPAAPAGAAQATTAPSRKVTVGYVAVLPWAPFFVGAEKGYFREQGIEIDLQPLSGGAEILTQTAAGNFDVGSGGSSAYFNAMGQARARNIKAPVRVVAPLHLEKAPLATPLVVVPLVVAALDRFPDR
jgi:NitT/TauT family transport system substrate-binding protein